MMAISSADKLDLLKMEYEKLTTEQRMYIEQYAPTLNVFGVTVLAGFAAALVHSQYQIIYPFLPFVLFIIAYIGIGQTHMVAALGLRIKAIEEELRTANNGEPILRWESLYAPRLVFAWRIRLRLKGPSETKGFVNPMVVVGGCIGLSGIVLVICCCYKAGILLTKHYGHCVACIYILVIISFAVITIWQSCGFFRLGKWAPRLDLD